MNTERLKDQVDWISDTPMLREHLESLTYFRAKVIPTA